MRYVTPASNAAPHCTALHFTPLPILLPGGSSSLSDVRTYPLHIWADVAAGCPICQPRESGTAAQRNRIMQNESLVMRFIQPHSVPQRAVCVNCRCESERSDDVGPGEARLSVLPPSVTCFSNMRLSTAWSSREQASRYACEMKLLIVRGIQNLAYRVFRSKPEDCHRSRAT